MLGYKTHLQIQNTIVKKDLPIPREATQGVAVLHSVAEVCGDGVGHDALLHRALEQEA